MRADLHLHTHFSDGKYSPQQVVQKAAEAGLQRIAITDHDTVSGIAEARIACLETNLECVSGVEISSEISDNEIHMLAYDFDPEYKPLLGLFELQRERRQQRAIGFVGALRESGVNIPPSDELSLGEADKGTVGRPHIARLIVDAGSAASMDEAFAKYLVPGTSTFVPKSFPEVEDVLKLIEAAGGVSILAHPGHFTSHADLLMLIDLGLNGVEVIHPSHDEVLQEYYGNLANRFNLIATGGSDFHGWREGDEEKLGSYYTEWPSEGNLFHPRTL